MHLIMSLYIMYILIHICIYDTYNLSDPYTTVLMNEFESYSDPKVIFFNIDIYLIPVINAKNRITKTYF